MRGGYAVWLMLALLCPAVFGQVKQRPTTMNIDPTLQWNLGGVKLGANGLITSTSNGHSGTIQLSSDGASWLFSPSFSALQQTIQTITTTPGTVTAPLVYLNYDSSGTKYVNLPTTASTTQRRVTILKTSGFGKATIRPQSGQKLDGVTDGTYSISALGQSVTFNLVSGSWNSYWGAQFTAPDGQNVVMTPGSTSNDVILYSDTVGGGKIKILDTTQANPSTLIQANLLQLGLGGEYPGANLSGASNGYLSLSPAGLTAPDGSNLVLRSPSGKSVVLQTDTSATQALLTADSGGKLLSVGGFSGDGSSLTGLTATQVGLGNVTNESKATMFTSPTFTGTTPVFPTQTANMVFAGPTTGAAAAPTFRALVTADIPNTIPTLAAANAYTNTASYQPGAAYDTAALGAELLDATAWTLNSGWTYASGSDWTQGFIHSGAVTAVNSTPTNGGTGYTLNDVLTLTTGDGTATVTATGVSGGVVTAVTLTSGGTTGYRGGTGQATSGGTGNGCTVNVTAIAGGTGELTHSDTPTIGANYHIAFTVSDYTGGYFTVTYGGLTTISQYASGTFGVKAVTTGGLSMTPSTNFSGTIAISIKPVTLYPSAITVKDSAGVPVVEMRSSVGGNKNLYLGRFGGQYTTTGTENTGFGYNALGNVSAGTTNTAVGALALQNLSGGLANTALGYNAGSSITSGVQNLCLGASSGTNITSGRYNTAIGPASLGSTTTAGFNVALGYQSLSRATGSNNVGIGGYSLRSATGAGNIGIGHYSGGYATSSNEFYVNNKDQVDTATEKSNSLLYGVMGATAANQSLAVNGKLKIDPSAAGYVAPTEALDVTGNIKASGTIAATGSVTSNSYPLARWRGGGTTDPSTNLVDGDLFYNTTTSELKVYYNSAWRTAAPPAP